MRMVRDSLFLVVVCAIRPPTHIKHMTDGRRPPAQQEPRAVHRGGLQPDCGAGGGVHRLLHLLAGRCLGFVLCVVCARLWMWALAMLARRLTPPTPLTPIDTHPPQTIFTYRTRTTSRLCGWVLTAAELAVFLVNFDLLAYVPLFFFAATLHFIAAEVSLVAWGGGGAFSFAHCVSVCMRFACVLVAASLWVSLACAYVFVW